VDTWLDKEKLLPGQDWEYEIRKAVREADVVVVCLSKQFNQAGFRQKEVRLALDTAMEKPEGEIFIIPARLEKCDTLESLRKWHWVDLFENDGYEMLMRALRARAEKIGALFISYKKSNDDQKVNATKNTAKRINSSKDILFSEQKLQQKNYNPISPHQKSRSQDQSLLITAFLGMAIIASLGMIGFWLISNIIENNLNIMPSATSVVTEPHEATETPAALFPTSTPVLPIITTEFGPEMVLVPAGEFLMGGKEEQALAECKKFRNGSGNDCQPGWFINEEPPHNVYLNSFLMDRTEVTNEMYAKCVESGACQPPKHSDPRFYPKDYYEVYYENPEYANYPVVYVAWDDAQNYCVWRDGRLPTEAEWEKTARGIDGRVYPWGDVIDCSYANHQTKDGVCTFGEYINIAPVGSYPNGMSPYGALDMAGNVAEWVSDWYDVNYYGYSSVTNPLGPSSGDFHVIRGGSWVQDAPFLRTTARTVYSSYEPNDETGFRCAKDAPP
jgi:formylglycine-generating enzyme required for sulfatase activity